MIEDLKNKIQAKFTWPFNNQHCIKMVHIFWN